ncbi:MAG: hypothetical protein SOT56_07665 [Eubacteriales bacterium]|nr:hypothetical protein [Eubacteriales bacterium]
MKKIMSVLLAVLFCAAALAACKTNDDPKPAQSTSGGNKETQTTQSGDGLPDDLDFKGTKLSIAIRDKYTEYYLGEEGGDLIWAAVYKANQVVDERLHITREYVKTSESSVDHVNKVVTDILSNESTYDLVLVDQFYGCAKALDGAFANIKDEQYSKYLDLEKDYWYSDYMSNLTLSEDTLYFLGGDASPTIISWTSCTFFNWDLYDSYYGDPNALFRLVDNGGWTIDKLAQYSKEVYKDLDDSKTINENDQVGFTVSTGQSAVFAAQCAGMTFSKRDGDGNMELDVVNSKNQSIFEKIYNLYNATEGVYAYDYRTISDDLANKMFADGKALFMNEYFLRSWSEFTRNMNDAYAIIPRPKLDESQKDYISVMQDPLMLYTIPISLDMSKADAVSAFLEAQGIENHKTVFPAIYDTALKIKFVSDKVDSEVASHMVDLIYSSMTSDFAVINGFYLNSIADTVGHLVERKENTFVSSMQAILEGAQQKLEEMKLNYRV